MNTKLFTTMTVLAAVSGSAVLFTGCQPEWEPMPPGVYIQPVEKDPERVEVPKTDTVLPAAPAADLSTPAAPVVQEPLPVLPPPAAVPPKTPAPKKIRKAPRKVEVRKEEIRYVVKKGDSLARIAYRYGLKIRTLKEYNDLKKNVIHPNQVLLIPPTSSAEKVSANLKDVKKVSGTKGKKRTRKASLAIPADGIHKVKARENFTTIARLYGITVADMVAANPGVNSARLRVGQKLKIAAASAGREERVVKPVSNETASGKTVTKPAVDKVADPVTPAAGNGTDRDDPSKDDLFKDIQSPEEAAGTQTPDAAAPAAQKEAAAEKKDTAMENADILSGDETTTNLSDTVVTTPDGKIQVTLAQPVTLEGLAKKYNTTVEELRKENANLPVSGELKAGTKVVISNLQ